MRSIWISFSRGDIGSTCLGQPGNTGEAARFRWKMMRMMGGVCKSGEVSSNTEQLTGLGLRFSFKHSIPID